MKGYVVMDAEIINTEAYSEFAEKSAAAIAVHGGRLLARTSNIEVIQGDWVPKRFVILEFDSLESAKGYVDSAEYAALDAFRRRATRANIVILEGYDSKV